MCIQRHLVEKYLEQAVRANIGGLGRLLTQELPDPPTDLVLTNVAGRQVQQLCKVKGMFLYSSVSSQLDRSKRFTLHTRQTWHRLIAVHSGTNSTSPGSILAVQQLRATTIHSHFHHCLYSQILIYIAE